MLGLIKRYGPRLSSLLVLRGIALVGFAFGTRLLTGATDPGTFGEFKLIVGLGSLLIGLVFRPVNAYAMRALHDADEAGVAGQFTADARRSTRLLALAVSLISVAAGATVAVATGDQRALLVAGAASLSAFAVATVGLENGLLLSTGRVELAAATNAFTAIALPVVATASVLVWSSSIGMVVTQSILLLIAAVALTRLGPILLLAPIGPMVASSLRWARQSLPYALPLAIVGGAAWAFNIGDRYLLAALTTTKEVGTYSAAYGLAATPIAALGGLLPSLVYAPVFRAAARSQVGRRRATTSRLIRYQLFTIGAAVVAVIILAPLASTVFLAPDFRDGAVAIMRWVAIGQGFQVLAFAFDLDSLAVSETSRIARAYLVAVAVSLGLNLVLVPIFGGLGASQATAGGGFAYFLAMAIQRNRSERHPTSDPK